MRKVIVAFLLVVGVATLAFAVAAARARQQLRYCGHPRDLWSEMMPFRATHCCIAGGVVSDLSMIYGAQILYHDDHGTFATSFVQLTDAPWTRHGCTYSLVGDGSQWSVVVPREEVLPGSYLLTRAGKIYFSTKAVASTNDVLLRDLTK